MRYTQNMSEWLDKLQVGDEVVVDSSSIGAIPYITKVARLTETLIVTESGQRYRRKDGVTLGSGSYCSFLQEPTQEIVDAISQRNLASHLRQVQWSDLPLDKLRAVIKLLPRKSSRT